jgi:homeodomain-containing protein
MFRSETKKGWFSEFRALANQFRDRLKILEKVFLCRIVSAHTRGMGRPPLTIDVTPKDQKELTRLLGAGVQQVRVVLRALALLQLARGDSALRISLVVPLTAQAIRTIGRRYQRGGLEAALFERQRPSAAAVLDDGQKQRIIAMVCSDPPEGRARWTVRLVAQEAVKQRLIPRVGRETIRILLLDHDLRPWQEKHAVRGRTQ